MFFILSKVLASFAQPSNVILLLAAGGTLLLFTRRWRAGRLLCASAALLLLILGFPPGGALLLAPLENRFPGPPNDMAAPDVILVLGGAFDTSMTEARNIVSLNESAGRMTQAVALARRYPSARVIFTGGSANLVTAGMMEADVARRFFDESGLAPERVSYESGSRNTYENATFTQAKYPPKPGERWLLVTSAFHMPRAMGIFRRAGFPVTAYPAHYLTAPGVWQAGSVSGGLRLTEIATREWIGLAAYRITGRTDALFPAP